MRIFWALIGVLAVVTAALFLWPAGDERRSGGESARGVAYQSDGPSQRDARPAADPRTATDPRIADGAEAGPTEAADGDATLAEPLDVAEAGARAPEASGAQAPADELAAARAATPEESLEPVAPVAAAEATPEAEPEAAAATEPAAGAGAVVRQEDGSLLIDDRFVVKGSGTKSDPYLITWEYLLAAGETYKPRLGQTELPEWLTMMDGKHVRITGYVAFPIMAESQDEMLVMLNQWDGCCIGIPPTPYDAVEVKLKNAAVGQERFMIYGTVEGVLGVDPYLVRDWLVGLYTMDDAVLSPAE